MANSSLDAVFDAVRAFRNRQAGTVTINDIISTNKQFDQSHMILIDQQLEKVHDGLHDALPKLDEAQKEEVKRRLPRFLAKLGIKWGMG